MSYALFLKSTQVDFLSLLFCLKGAIPRKCLPNQGGHQDENDYIYYDRESGDKAATKVMEARDDLTELSGESIVEKDDKGTNSYNFELCWIFVSTKCKPIFLIPNIMSNCTLDQMEVTEAGNPDDATSKTTHLKSTMVIYIYVVLNVNWPFFASNL